MIKKYDDFAVYAYIPQAPHILGDFRYFVNIRHVVYPVHTVKQNLSFLAKQSLNI